MTKRRKLANWIGSLSLVLSFAFWLFLLLGSARRPLDREFFMQGLNALAFVWLPVWLLATLFAVVAATLGSRRWLFAVLAPLTSAWLSWTLLASIRF
ncbi:MAG: hypothetical protein ACLQHF_06855 [Terracidiphilus sp.]